MVLPPVVPRVRIGKSLIPLLHGQNSAKVFFTPEVFRGGWSRVICSGRRHQHLKPGTSNITKIYIICEYGADESDPDLVRSPMPISSVSNVFFSEFPILTKANTSNAGTNPGRPTCRLLVYGEACSGNKHWTLCLRVLLQQTNLPSNNTGQLLIKRQAAQQRRRR